MTVNVLKGDMVLLPLCWYNDIHYPSKNFTDLGNYFVITNFILLNSIFNQE